MRPRIYLTYEGETKLLRQWGEIYKLPHKALIKRFRMGWDVEKILETPLRTAMTPLEKDLRRQLNNLKARERYKNKESKREVKWIRHWINEGIKEYVVNMAKYYTKEHRLRCQKQLRKDFENMQRHLQVA